MKILLNCLLMLRLMLSSPVMVVKCWLRVALSSRICAMREEITARFYQSSLQAQRGAVSVAWLEALFVGIILLVVLVQFLMQQGLPMLISATSNTTALTDAGADAATVSWVGFIGSAIVIFLLVGALVIGIRVATGAGGMNNSGGGGGGRRRKKR